MLRRRTKASVEAVLREGESLTQFIGKAPFAARLSSAPSKTPLWPGEGCAAQMPTRAGLMTAEDFLAGMAQRAKAAQQRIREAATARKKRAGYRVSA